MPRRIGMEPALTREGSVNPHHALRGAKGRYRYTQGNRNRKHRRPPWPLTTPQVHSADCAESMT